MSTRATSGDVAAFGEMGMNMKNFLKLTLMSVFVWGMAGAQDDPPGRVGRLNFVSGAVSFQPGGVDDWAPATINRPLTTGDRLWADRDARAEVHIGSTAIRLGSQTAFEFLNLNDSGVQVRLAEGSLVVRLRRLDESESFEVDTPNMAFSLLRPGEYRIDSNPDAGTTTVTVRGGEGEVTGGNQAFPVHARQQARVSGFDTLTFDTYDIPPPDGWDRWCESRDIRDDRPVRYVSRDMVGYEDLDQNGTWRDVPGYGPVWTPTTVAAGWAPYHDGRWVWVEPWGWTWVDEAPWGFAPFHYGRWAFIGGGWGWVPGPVVSVRPVYAPALVAFVGGPHFSLSMSIGGGVAGVAWFPLGPRDVFVPAYHVSPMYVQQVNVTNTTITNVNITNINVANVHYANQNVVGAVTAVPQSAFANSQPVGRVAVAVNPREIASAQVMGSAAIAPRQESVMGRVQAGGPAPHPPAAIMSRAVVAKATPPPPQVPFAQRQAALAANPGRPLDTQQLGRIRGNSAPPPNPLVRPAMARQTGAPSNPVNPGRPAAMSPGPVGTPTRPQNASQPPLPVQQTRPNYTAPAQQPRPATTTPPPANESRPQYTAPPQPTRPATTAPPPVNEARPQYTPPPPQHSPAVTTPPPAQAHPQTPPPKEKEKEKPKKKTEEEEHKKP